MSRIGNSPIKVPDGVSINLHDNKIIVSGNLGSLELNFHGINIEHDNSIITLKRNSETNDIKSKHGLYRSLINNMVTGVSSGFTKELELVGVGYRAALKGNQLNLQLGYSHDINFDIPEGIKVTVEKQTTLKIIGSDKQQVGEVASKLKILRKIEPYKGKGVREKGQYVLKKEGKKK